MDDLLNVLVESGIKKLDLVLQEDEEFINLQNETEEATKNYDALDLDRNAKLIIDRMVSAYNSEGAYYGEVAYRLGILDCVELLKELNIL